MTTRIHIVNFGPDVVEVNLGPLYNHPPKQIYSQGSESFYVFDGQDVTVKEVRQRSETPTEIPQSQQKDSEKKI